MNTLHTTDASAALARDIESEAMPLPPAARKVHLAYIGVVAALCVFGFLWDPLDAVLLIALATAARFSLVRWLTRRAYAPWLGAG